MTQTNGPVGPRLRTGFAVAAAALAVVLAGCSSGGNTSGAGTSAAGASAAGTSVGPASSVGQSSTVAAPPTLSSQSSSHPKVSPPARSTAGTKIAVTVTRTLGGGTITVEAAKPPAATKEPAAADGVCPFLDADVVSDITGQHHGQTQLINLTPHPVCIFYRSDGGLMGSVRVITAANPQAAIAAVNQHVPVADSQPASQPAGWVGGSTTSAGQMTQDSTAKSVYAVSKGNIAIVAEENESPSIKARVMAVCAIYALGLEAGAKPDYCSVSG